MSICVTFFFIPYRGVGLKLEAMYAKLTKLILQTGGLFYHLTSWKESILIQKPSLQLPNLFQQYGNSEKTMIYI